MKREELFHFRVGRILWSRSEEIQDRSDDTPIQEISDFARFKPVTDESKNDTSFLCCDCRNGDCGGAAFGASDIPRCSGPNA